MKIDPETEIVTITWKMADIIEAMETREFEVNEANIRKVLAYKNLKNLEDRSIECGWDIIYNMVEEAKMSKKKFMTPNEMNFAIGCGSKKYIDYTEGMKLYGLGKGTFVTLAKEAGALREIKGRRLVHIPTLEAYIETMFGTGTKDE